MNFGDDIYYYGVKNTSNYDPELPLPIKPVKLVNGNQIGMESLYKYSGWSGVDDSEGTLCVKIYGKYGHFWKLLVSNLCQDINDKADGKTINLETRYAATAFRMTHLSGSFSFNGKDKTLWGDKKGGKNIYALIGPNPKTNYNYSPQTQNYMQAGKYTTDSKVVVTKNWKEVILEPGRTLEIYGGLNLGNPSNGLVCTKIEAQVYSRWVLLAEKVCYGLGNGNGSSFKIPTISI